MERMTTLNPFDEKELIHVLEYVSESIDVLKDDFVKMYPDISLGLVEEFVGNRLTVYDARMVPLAAGNVVSHVYVKTRRLLWRLREAVE